MSKSKKNIAPVQPRALDARVLARREAAAKKRRTRRFVRAEARRERAEWRAVAAMVANGGGYGHPGELKSGLVFPAAAVYTTVICRS
jgi:hypothetical protein